MIAVFWQCSAPAAVEFRPYVYRRGIFCTAGRVARERVMSRWKTLQKMSQLLNDEKNPPTDAMRVMMLQALQGVQAAMQRLQGIKTSEEAENAGPQTPNSESPTTE